MPQSLAKLAGAACLAALLAACGGTAVADVTSSAAGPSATAEAAGPSATPQPAQIQPGGTWTRALDADPDTLNPILSNTSAGAAVNAMIFPTLIRQQPFTGQWVPDGSMSERWEVSPDGLSYTFHLRSGVSWSDGDPVDAADFRFTYAALASELVESPHKGLMQAIAAVEVLNPLALRVTFRELHCHNLDNLRLGWLPSHLYEADYSDIMENSLNTAPIVSAGPFIFQSWTPGETIVLRRNGRYWQGAPNIERMVFQVVPDPAASLDELLAGQIDVTTLAPAQLSSVRANPDFTIFSTGDDGYDFIALNLANPDNPQPGRDANGALIAQDPHPILGDPTVREAIAHALDYETIVESIYVGRAYRLATNVLPLVTWAHDANVPVYEYNPDRARQLLEAAGWEDTNNDGIREKEVRTLSLTLLTSADNELYSNIGNLVEDQLNAVGFNVTFRELSLNDLLRELLGQGYDMVITGWAGLGVDSDDTELWSSQADMPGSGFNFVSYQNVKVEELLQRGSSIQGCRPEDRAPIYRQIQQLIHANIPYIFLAGRMVDTGYATRWAGLQPAPWDFYWNVHQWYLKAPQ